MKSNNPSRFFGLAAVAAVASAASIASGQLFTENFSDGNAASRWGSAYQLESSRDISTGPDGLVNFAFDYSTLGIASPTGSGDTIGAAIGVNLTDQTGDEGESYIIYPLGGSFSGSFSVQADMYVYNDGLAGSTELGMAGLFLNNSAPVAPYQWGTEGGPLAWIYSGEGGSSADLARFSEGNASSTGYLSLGDYNALPAGTIPGFQTGVSGSLGPAVDNASGAWVKVRIEVDGSDVNYYLNDALVNTYDNSGGFYTEGNIFFGLTDPFNSANAGNRAIIDNVLVQVVPEPSALALGLLGLVSIWAVRRRQ